MVNASDPPDPDRTILVPTPGRKPGARPPPPDADSDATMMPPPPPGQAAAQAVLGHGLNRLVAAANPLLNLVLPLRLMNHYTQVEQLRAQLAQGIRQFEHDAKAAQMPQEAIAVARYSLCTFLDEIISATPWGSGGVWASHSLLVSFHSEASGGEKFFLLLQKLCREPAQNIETLELMYLCLALGLEGRYRVLEGGRGQLDVLRERLRQLIAQQRGPYEPALSLNWRGAGGGQALWRGLPVWVVGAVALALLVLLQIVLSFRLGGKSTPVYQRLSQVVLPALAMPTPAVAAPMPALPSSPRLARFLADEIAAGRVSVADLPDRSIVTLNGNGMFASGSAEVAGEFLPLMQKIGEALKAVPGQVRVIGHTDSTKGFSANFPSNWELSKGRAAATAALLAERAGPAARYSVEGKGDGEPLGPNDTPEHRARNRRVVIMLLTPPAA
jgi:type VI secretion system protein ImpK